MGESYSWKARGVAVRDARHTHNGPEISGAPTKHKDTKRWCRGKAGVEHTLVVVVMRRFTLFPELVRHCSTCGKEFGRYSHHVWSVKWRPEWATDEHLKALERAKQEPRVESDAGSYRGISCALIEAARYVARFSGAAPNPNRMGKPAAPVPVELEVAVAPTSAIAPPPARAP